MNILLFYCIIQQHCTPQCCITNKCALVLKVRYAVKKENSVRIVCLRNQTGFNHGSFKWDLLLE